MNRSESPYSLCGALRRDLELYAEGELLDRRSIERVRRHLGACDACTEYLRFHDELTTSLLADSAGAIDGGQRVDRILELVGSIDSRSVAEPVSRPRARGPGVTGPIAAPAAPRKPRRFHRVLFRAAASVLAAGWIVLWVLTGQKSVLDLATDGRPGSDSARSGIAAASAQEPTPRRDAVDLRWVLDGDGNEVDPTRARRASLLRLYGFRPDGAPQASPGDAERDSPPGVPEWIVDAGRGGSPRGDEDDRVFLVEDDAEAGGQKPVEIHPVMWSAASGPTLPRALELMGSTRIYRVLVIRGPAGLHARMLPEPSASRDVAPGRVLDPSRRAGHWTFSASWAR